VSENVSYTATVLSGGSENVLREALQSKGVQIRNDSAWTTARERSDRLQEELRAELARHTAAVSSLGTQAGIRAGAMLSAFLRVPAFREYAEQTRSGLLAEIRNGLEEVRSPGLSDPERGNVASAIENRIENLATQIQEDLCTTERDALAGIVSRSLGSLGYLVENRGGSLKATANRTCVWVEVSPWADISLDFSGWSGMACLREVRRVEERLAREGLTLRKTAEHNHGNPRGGAVAQRLKPLFPAFRRSGLVIHETSRQTITQKGGQ